MDHDSRPQIFDRVLTAVCVALHEQGMYVSRQDVVGKTHHRPVSMGRHMVIFVLRKHFGFTTTKAGAHVGRHHTSAVHATQVMTSEIMNDPVTGEVYKRVCALVGTIPILRTRTKTERKAEQAVQRKVVSPIKRIEHPFEPLMWPPDKLKDLVQWRKEHPISEQPW